MSAPVASVVSTPRGRRAGEAPGRQCGARKAPATRAAMSGGWPARPRPAITHRRLLGINDVGAAAKRDISLIRPIAAGEEPTHCASPCVPRNSSRALSGGQPAPRLRLRRTAVFSTAIARLRHRPAGSCPSAAYPGWISDRRLDDSGLGTVEGRGTAHARACGRTGSGGRPRACGILFDVAHRELWKMCASITTTHSRRGPHRPLPSPVRHPAKTADVLGGTDHGKRMSANCRGSADGRHAPQLAPYRARSRPWAPMCGSPAGRDLVMMMMLSPKSQGFRAPAPAHCAPECRPRGTVPIDFQGGARFTASPSQGLVLHVALCRDRRPDALHQLRSEIGSMRTIRGDDELGISARASGDMVAIPAYRRGCRPRPPRGEIAVSDSADWFGDLSRRQRETD